MTKFRASKKLRRICQTLRAMSSPDGWTKWSGGKCPVQPNDKVGALLVSGAKTGVVIARDLDWKHWGSGNDIAAYKVIEKSSG